MDILGIAGVVRNLRQGGDHMDILGILLVLLLTGCVTDKEKVAMCKLMCEDRVEKYESLTGTCYCQQRKETR